MQESGTAGEALAQMAPGPELALLLAGIDVTTLAGFEVVAVLKAQYRQVAHERARLLTVVLESGLRDDPDSLDRMAAPDEWAAEETRAGLGLTRKAAETLFGLAYDTCVRLPELGAAMAAGELDEPRAKLLAEWTLGLSPEHAHAVCADLLPRCALSGESILTTGKLIDRVKTVAIGLDPQWARKRYEAAVAGRRVVARRNADGSADLSGLDLPVDRVAASSSRIDGLAKAAKRAGDSRGIDALRADLMLGMTDGTYAGITDAQILALPTATVFEPATEPEPDFASEPEADLASDLASELASEPEPPPEPERPRRAGVELRVRLSTLLGLDQLPGELAGWGPVHAELARTLTADLGVGQWRWALTDDDGHLISAGLTPARPGGVRLRSARSKATVDLVIAESLLRDLREGDLAARIADDPAVAKGWRPVIADLARRVSEVGPGPPGDEYRRFAKAGLRREVQIGTPTCIGVGCRAPASTTDLDHTRDHAQGGPTTRVNLGPACRHDHRLKGEGGWTVRRIGPGYVWTSRLGHTYRVEIPPVLPAPPGSDRDSLGRPWQESTILDPVPPRPESKPVVAAYDPAQDPPPF